MKLNSEVVKDIQKISNLDDKDINLLLEKLADLSPAGQNAVFKRKQELFTKKYKKSISKSILDLVCLSEAIQELFEKEYPEKQNEKIRLFKRKKKCKKFEKLDTIRDVVQKEREQRALRELEDFLREQYKVDVSHTYLAKYLASIEKGER